MTWAGGLLPVRQRRTMGGRARARGEETMPSRWTRALPALFGLGAPVLALLTAAPLPAQDLEPDPCASTVTLGELRTCWERQLESAEGEMKEAVAAVRNALPKERQGTLKKAQELWLEFRNAHVSALYGTNWHDIDRFTCALIARRQMTRARTAELKRMLRDVVDTASCPL